METMKSLNEVCSLINQTQGILPGKRAVSLLILRELMTINEKLDSLEAGADQIERKKRNDE